MRYRPCPTTMAPSVLMTLAGAAVALAALPGQINLASLDGTDGFSAVGVEPFALCGISVASAGDFNGDGIDDLIVGAADTTGSASSSGVAYIIFGSATLGAGGAFDLTSLSGTNGFILNGVSTGDNAGETVAGIGDINGDTYDDVIIGAPQADPGGGTFRGSIYVVFGGPTVGASGAVDLSALNGSNGFLVNGLDIADIAGVAVDGLGDVNGDTYPDIIIGAPKGDPGAIEDAGEAYILFGSAAIGASGEVDLASLNGANGFIVTGAAPFDNLGLKVAGAGDVNGDSFNDILIGASQADPGGIAGAGEAYLIFGGPAVGAAGALAAADLSGPNGFVMTGIDAEDRAGEAVAGAGDVNGDTYGDIIIGAPRADPAGLGSGGETYIVFGGPSVGAGGAIALSGLNGSNGFTVSGTSIYAYSGCAVSDLGDVDGDGFDDIAIGAYGASPSGITLAGAAYIVFGSASVGASGTIDLTILDGSNATSLNGETTFDFVGTSVGRAGDLNNDGVADIVTGAPGADPGPSAGPGAFYVVFGEACPGDLSGDGMTDAADFVILAANFGMAVVPYTNGDMNGDGFVDAADFTILATSFGCGA